MRGVEARAPAFEREQRRAPSRSCAAAVAVLALDGAGRAALERGPRRGRAAARSSARSGTTRRRGRRRRRGADVGGEIAERRVLLVARPPRRPAPGRRRPRARPARRRTGAGPRSCRRRARARSRRRPAAQSRRARRRSRRARAGPARTSRRRRRSPAGSASDAGQHVALRRRVVAGDEPDQPRDARQRPLARRVRTGPRPRASASAAPARRGARRARSARSSARAGASRRAARTAPARPKTCTRSPSPSPSSSASNCARCICTARLAPLSGSLSVKNTDAQRSCRRSSVTSPSTQTRRQPAEPGRDPWLNARTAVDLAAVDLRRLDLHGGDRTERRALLDVVPKDVGSSGPPWRLSAVEGSSAPRRRPDESAR